MNRRLVLKKRSIEIWFNGSYRFSGMTSLGQELLVHNLKNHSGHFLRIKNLDYTLYKNRIRIERVYNTKISFCFSLHYCENLFMVLNPSLSY